MTEIRYEECDASLARRVGQAMGPVAERHIRLADGFAWIALAGVAAFGAITVLSSAIGPATTPENTDVGSPASIGHAFLDQHIIAFEVTSLILLIAAVGAVILAKRAVMLEGGR